MASECVVCGCDCKNCSSSDSQLLRTAVADLCKRLNESEGRSQDLERQLKEFKRASEEDVKKGQESTSSALEQHKRLKDSYDEAVRRNQELESKVLKLADELQVEKDRFDEALMAMTERLVDATENMNRMEKETVKNRKDCSLVVQLLKCNQSVNKDFVSEMVNTFPLELKQKLQGELQLKEPVQTTTRQQRSKSTPVVDANGNGITKPTASKRSFLQRSKSTNHESTRNGSVPNGIVDLPKKAVKAVYTGSQGNGHQPTRL